MIRADPTATSSEVLSPATYVTQLLVNRRSTQTIHSEVVVLNFYQEHHVYPHDSFPKALSEGTPIQTTNVLIILIMGTPRQGPRILGDSLVA